MIHLEKINGENIWDILKLNVSDSQKNFVASNNIRSCLKNRSCTKGKDNVN